MRHCVQDYPEKSLLQVRNISRVMVFIVPLLRDGGKTRASLFFLERLGRGCFRKTRGLAWNVPPVSRADSPKKYTK